VQCALKRTFPKKKFSLKIIQTLGDEYQSVDFFRRNNVGVFTKAIERELLAGRIDVAVHSLKDLPTETAKGLKLAAVPKREDVRDAFISSKRYTLETLPFGAVVGTGSPRRKRQLSLLRPDLQVTDMRGNLDTRVRKAVKEKSYDAVLIARAGLLRVKKYLKYASPVSEELILPAVGQAALGLQVRASDAETTKIVGRLNHAKTQQAVEAEREFLSALHGGCRVPVGVLTKSKGNQFTMKAAVFSVNTSNHCSAVISGRTSDSRKLARRLARTLLKLGAARFLKEARA
jgi:hydroxymethylbilane synthase